MYIVRLQENNYLDTTSFGPFLQFKEAKQKFNTLMKEKVGLDNLKNFFLSMYTGSEIERESLANRDMKELMGIYTCWGGDGVFICIENLTVSYERWP